MIKTLSLSSLKINSHSRILILMPHPDDEAVFISGFIQKLTKQNTTVKVVTFTAGEGSTLRFGLPSKTDLAAARKIELCNSLKILGVANHSVLSFQDGKLDQLSAKLVNRTKDEINQFKPTHVFTLESDGIYGHPDHIALSQAVSKAVKLPVRLIYITVSPDYIFPLAKRMAKKTEIKPLKPDIALKLTPLETINKIRSLRAHSSQFQINLFHFKSLKFFYRNHMLTSEFFTFAR